MPEENTDIYRIDADNDLSNDTSLTPSNKPSYFRFEIQHLLWLTVIVGLAFGLRTADLIYVSFCSLTIALCCLSSMVVYFPIPKRIQKQTRAESVLQALVFRIVVICSLLMLFCVCSLALQMVTATDSAESWNEMLKTFRFFENF